uniref:Fatty acid synthase n=1 Tax=Cacopsylla melanoneura TaxID=428564 RepID=A0A8D8U1H1_9HEMI
MKRFPDFPSNNIFLNTNYDYFMHIGLRHTGKGLNLIVNPMKDETHFEFSWNSLAMNGEIVQVGIKETNSFGMFKFCKSQSVVGLDAGVLLGYDDAVKKQIFQFINKGIETGVIKPIAAKIGFGHYERQFLTEGAYRVIPLNTRQTSVCPTLDVNPDSSYVIIGDNEGYAVCHWLMHRGARKFVFESSNDFRSSKMLSLLEKFGALGMLSRNNCETLSGTEALFTDARGLGDVAAVFAVNLKGKDCSIKLKNIKKVCDEQKSIAFLSSLLCSESCKWHFEIPADILKTIANILPTLDASLKTMSKYTLPLEQEGSLDSSIRQTPNYNPHQLLNAHLPLDHLENLHSEIIKLKTSTFVEHTSLSLRKDLAYNMLPVFFIPGLSQTSLKRLIGKMLHPSFLANIPVGWSVDNIVTHLYKSLKHIQPKGLYTLVAESWSGLYAFKLAEYMEKKGDRVNLILLEASPSLLKSIVEDNKDIFANEKSLAEYIVQNKDIQHVDVHIRSSVELSCKIILDRVKHHRETVIDHKFNGECYIVTSEQFLSNNNVKDLYKMIKTVSAFLSTPVVSPFDFSSAKEVISFVNDNVALEWW